MTDINPREIAERLARAMGWHRRNYNSSEWYWALDCYVAPSSWSPYEYDADALVMLRWLIDQDAMPDIECGRGDGFPTYTVRTYLPGQYGAVTEPSPSLARAICEAALAIVTEQGAA